MRAVAVMLLFAVAGPAWAEGAFCELTPCVPGPVTRRTLKKHEPAGGVLCKRGQELGVDADRRLVFCTTARAVTVGGLRIAADAYTLFHPNGRIYQTHLAARHTATLANGATVTCGADLIALDDAGHVLHCRLAAALPGAPRARVGEPVAFHPSGSRAASTLDEAAQLAGLTLPAGTTVMWSETGAFVGAHLRAPLSTQGLSIRGELTVHPSGALRTIELAAETTIQGHPFPMNANLAFRSDGTLEHAEYISDHGFMIHGEPWEITRTVTYAPDGHELGAIEDRYQAPFAPRKFRK